MKEKLIKRFYLIPNEKGEKYLIRTIRLESQLPQYAAISIDNEFARFAHYSNREEVLNALSLPQHQNNDVVIFCTGSLSILNSGSEDIKQIIVDTAFFNNEINLIKSYLTNQK